MTTARRIQLTAAIACFVLAMAGVAITLFAPTTSVSTETAVAISVPGEEPVVVDESSTTESRSLIDDGVEPAAVVYFVVMVALAAVVLLASFAHGRSWGARTAAPLWLAAGAMTFLAFIAGFSIGLFFFPAAVAGIAAAIAASRYAASTAGANPRRPTTDD